MFAGGSWKSESAVFKMLDLPLVFIVTAGRSQPWVIVSNKMCVM